MEARKLLIALYIEHKGNWNSIYEAVVKKEIPDTEKAEREVDNFLNFHQVITILDTEEDVKPFIDMVKKMNKPPFVMEYTGDKELLKLSWKDIVVAEEEEMAEALRSVELTTATLMQINTLPFIISPGKTTTGQLRWGIRIMKPGGRSIYLFEGEADPITERNNLAARLGGIGHKVLFSKLDTEDGKILLSSAINAGANIYAVPGEAGCKTNAIIKEGANLCDTPKDLLDNSEEKKEGE